MELWPERRFEIRHTVVDGVFVRRLDGDDARGTLLYVHGLGESGLCFERLAADERLRRWHHRIVDLPGYGKSGWERRPLTLDEHADRIAGLLAALADGPVVLVGHSMGGTIGTLLCERLLGERRPAPVRAFLNVEGNISLADCSYSSRTTRHDLASWLADGHPRLLDELYRAGCEHRDDQRESAAALRPYCASLHLADPRTFFVNAQELVALSGSETLADRLATLALPKTYFFGAPRGTGDLSRGLLRRAGVEMIGIPDAGHWPFLDQHDAFVREVVDFLDRLEPELRTP